MWGATAGVGTGARIEQLAYQLYEGVWSRWARRRYRRDFDRIERFCLFVGYPRSGHSLVGALLNAHPHAVISHELHAAGLLLGSCSRDELYARILARSWWFNLRGNKSNYAYHVPGMWQGRFEALRVIGDKRGGGVTRAIAAQPDFLERVRAVVGIPLRLIHVVRNPFDNISAIALWHGLSLEESIRFYFALCETTRALDALCRADELVTIRHETMVREPAPVLASLCRHLGLEPEPGYLARCCSIVFDAPTQTRRRLAWPSPLVLEVERRVRSHPFLQGYEFEAQRAGDGAP
jgi:hypothetical protein